MQRNLLSPAHATWLADTLARNRATFGGFKMELPDDGGDGGDGGGGNEPPFPANTAVKDMTLQQQVAYYEHKARKHEDRNKELLRITGGKYGEALEAEFTALGELRDKDRTDGERAVETARQEGRTAAITELGTKAARAAFELALGHSEDNDQSAVIDLLDLSKALGDDGSVDTAKVRAVVAAIAPADKGAGKQDPDYGGGRRQQQSTTGTATGRDLYEARRKKSTSTSK